MSKVREYLNGLTAPELQEVELLIMTKDYQAKMGNEVLQLAIDDPEKYFATTTLSDRPGKNRLSKSVRSWAMTIDRTLFIGEGRVQDFLNLATKEIQRLNEANKRCTPFAVSSSFPNPGKIVGEVSDTMPRSQKTSMRRAFYGACGILLLMFRDEITELEEEQAMETMENLFAQVGSFWRNEQNRQS